MKRVIHLATCFLLSLKQDNGHCRKIQALPLKKVHLEHPQCSSHPQMDKKNGTWCFLDPIGLSRWLLQLVSPGQATTLLLWANCKAPDLTLRLASSISELWASSSLCTMCKQVRNSVHTPFCKLTNASGFDSVFSKQVKLNGRLALVVLNGYGLHPYSGVLMSWIILTSLLLHQ